MNTPEDVVKRLRAPMLVAENLTLQGVHAETARRDMDEAASLIESLQEEKRRLREALKGILDRYVSLAESGDAGFWDCELEDPVIAARAALKGLYGTSPAMAILDEVKADNEAKADELRHKQE